MARPLRLDVGGEIYHCLNRAVGKQTIFKCDKDYRLFEKILEEVSLLTNVEILAYSIMPNHFHLVLKTNEDEDLACFMKHLTVTHTQRYRVYTNTVGEGPVYQGRYKSYIIQNDDHLFTVLRYVERNPLTANLVKNPLDWKYSSIYRRYKGTESEKKLLTEWPLEEPTDYISLLTEAFTEKEIEKFEHSEKKGTPYGSDEYVLDTVKKYGLESTQRGVGRPHKES